jgi:hypothetical protein
MYMSVCRAEQEYDPKFKVAKGTDTKMKAEM